MPFILSWYTNKTIVSTEIQDHKKYHTNKKNLEY